MENLKYKLTERLHTGHVYEIFKAVRVVDDVPVLLKNLRDPYPSVQAINQLRSEYGLLERLQGDTIIKVLAIEDFENSISLVFEQAPGQTLASYLGKEPVDMELFFEIALSLLEAIKRMHNARVVHRNISPENVLIEPSTGQLTLCGFSMAIELARDVHSQPSSAALEANLAYISPEQTGRMNVSADHRADLYSLGCVFYELLTGKVPFDFTDPMQLVHAHLALSPKPPHVVRADVPLMVSQVVLKLMSKSPDNRYQSAMGVLTDLRICEQSYSDQSGIPDFRLGENDISDQFRIPEKLYGRSLELEQLKGAYTKALSGTASLVLIGGYSGVGKTGLVREFQKNIGHNSCLFISGKFEQFKKDVPFSSLITAFNQLIRQLLVEEEQEVAQWRLKVLDAVGKSGQVLVDVVPDLALLIGPQPAVPELPAAEASNRFNELLNRFVAVFTQSSSHQLCLFLDDLQWVDSATRLWLESTLGNQEKKNLLFIGAYRDNEVDASHPLLLMLDRLHQNGATIDRIDLKPLTKASVGQMVAETLKLPIPECEDLTDILYQKTGGNPFFTRQCMWALYEENAISFDPVSNKWTYDIHKVKGANLSDNVLELMVGLIQRLPREVQTLLTIAACVGSRFDLPTIQQVASQTMKATAQQLSEAVHQGLVVPIASWAGNEENEYGFVHDRIQQAALSLLADSEKQVIRLRIGRRLLQANPQIPKNKLYDITNHLNYGVHLIQDQVEIQKLIELNLEASIQAKYSSAYEPALQYCIQSMELMRTEAWNHPTALTRSLLLQRAECEHLFNNNQEAEHFFDQALLHASEPLERGGIYLRKINYYSNLGKFELAYHTGREAVRQLGVILPPSFSPPLFVKDLVVNRVLMRNRAIADIIQLEEMTDERLKMAIQLMASFARAAYQIKPVLCISICTRIVNLCLKHGNTAGASVGFMAFGAIFMGAIVNQKQTGFDFGQLTLALVEKYKDLSFKAEAFFVVGYFAMPWRKPAREMEEYWHKAYETGLETGDLFHASCACCGLIQSYYMRGMAFDEILVYMERYQVFLARIDNQEALLTLLAVRQSIQNLKGATSTPQSYTDSTFNEDDHLLSLARFGTRHFAHYYFINKMQTLYLWREYEQAHAVSIQSDKYLTDSPGMLHTAEHYFYKGLILCSLYKKSSGVQRLKWKLALRKINSDFKKYAQGSPSNFLHKSQVLAGEICYVQGEVREAEKLFYAAIESAKNYGYLTVQALASELLGRLHFDSGRSREAIFHIRNSVYLYNKLGATAYADHLHQRYASQLDLIEEERSDADATLPQGNLKIEEEKLDLLSILKASEAISREIRLPDLMATFMKIITENAGAQRMVFVLPKGGDYVVEAEYLVDAGEVELLDDIPLTTYARIPKTVINYVIRTQEAVVLNEAEKGDFEIDTYIQSQSPRSILCVPLVQMNKMNGLIYLENNLTFGAFSQKRIQPLSLLSGQLAISIENALLYKNLEEKVVERTAKLNQSLEDLKATQTQLIQKEKMASLGELTAGIAHEIQNPLNFVNNFTELSSELILELKTEIEKGDTEEVEALLDDLSKNLEKVLSYGTRASGIVKNMLHHSRNTSGDWLQTDLNRLADEYFHLAYQGFQARDMAFFAKLDTDFDDTLGLINLIPPEIGRVFQNLFNNAFYAVTEKKGHLRGSEKEYQPTVTLITRRFEEYVEIRIIDNGTGIPESVIGKIFQPFFTTKPTGNGTGLGLSVSYDIITKGHNGTLTAESEEGKFTQMTIRLPFSVLIP